MLEEGNGFTSLFREKLNTDTMRGFFDNSNGPAEVLGKWGFLYTKERNANEMLNIVQVLQAELGCIWRSWMKPWNSGVRRGIFNNSTLLLSQTAMSSAYSLEIELHLFIPWSFHLFFFFLVGLLFESPYFGVLAKTLMLTQRDASGARLSNEIQIM